MIRAYIRLENDDVDRFDGKCELPVLPPIGGYIRVMDSKANIQVLRVVDIIVEAVSKISAQTPGGIGSSDGPRIDIICSDE